MTTKSDQSVHSDHDYCSPEKRRNSTVNIKAGQSLLKPEVLSSNNKILNSRHRACKNKKIVYSLSSDDEVEVKDKIKPSVKASVKTELHANHRKKHLITNNSLSSVSSKPKSAISVITKSASKASDNDSHSSSGSIKLTIKNKSKVILKLDNDCDDKKDSNVVVHTSEKVKDDCSNFNNVKQKHEKPLKQSSTSEVKKPNLVENESRTKIVEQTRPEKDFYINLFNNKQDVQIPKLEPSSEVTNCKNNLLIDDVVIKQENVEIKQPQKKKLNLQEYKLRKEGTTNTITQSPEAIFSDVDKASEGQVQSQQISNVNASVKVKLEDDKKKPFDPIREASRKILLNTQKQIARRQKYEDIIMTKIPKVENLELQPLISDAEMLKMVDNGVISKESLPLPVPIEKPKNSDYQEIIMVSVSTNTDQQVFMQLKREMEKEKGNAKLFSSNYKSAVNFKIKSSDKVMKQNVFDAKDKSSNPESHTNKRTSPNNQETVMNRKRFKDITATIKSVEKNADVKITSNSLFASIQDVVMKKALSDEEKVVEDKRASYSPKPKYVRAKVNIVREYNTKDEHGEDKVILHLDKNRTKPATSTIVTQTEASDEFGNLSNYQLEDSSNINENIRKKHDSESSNKSNLSDTTRRKSPSRPDSRIDLKRKESDKRSRSKDRYDRRRRSRSRSSMSRSRNKSYRSRSVTRYRRDYRHRRSVSSYRRSRRSRSPHHRLSKSRGYRFGHRSSSRSRKTDRSRSPVYKKRAYDDKVKGKERSRDESAAVKSNDSPSRTPPIRKTTTSESSCSSR